MTGDSLHFASSTLLLAASGFAFRVRGYLRFGAVLFAAFAIAALMGPLLAAAAAFLVMPLGGSALALFTLARFARPVPSPIAALLLVAGLVEGLVALLSGNEFLALLPLALAGVVMILVALHRSCFAAVFSGVFLVGGACAFAARGAEDAVLLFFSAALGSLAQLRKSSSAAMLSFRAP